MTCSGIPAQIGTCRAKIELYEHNPFLARPYSNSSFSFSPGSGLEVSEQEKNNLQFLPQGASLSPILNLDSTYIGVKTGPTGNNLFEYTVDLAKGIGNSPEVIAALPDKNTGRFRLGHFSQRLWVHTGSLYSDKVIAPKDYHIPPSLKTAITGTTQQFITFLRESMKSLFLLESGAAIWDMTHEPQSGSSEERVWPVMIGRTNCKSAEPVNWTVEKYCPLFQGEDFFFDFEVVNRDFSPIPLGFDTVHEAMTQTGVDPADNKNRMIGKYRGYFEPGMIRDFWDTSSGDVIDPGYSNQAFYVQHDMDKPDEDQTADDGTVTQGNITNTNSQFDSLYYKNKAYLLIEVGADDYKRTDGHNYFIELVAGSNPRFLHFSPQPRGHFIPDTVYPFGASGDEQADAKQNEAIAKYIYEPVLKCRVLSELQGLSVSELFNSGKFQISVQNVLGDLVISFISGKDKTNWVITRTDQQFDSTSDNFLKDVRVPMIIPYGTCKLHGGNMNLRWSWAPLSYPSKATAIYKNREGDTGQAENKDIYATFAQPGSNDSDLGASSKARGLFLNPRFDTMKMGYSCDSYYLKEIHANRYAGDPQKGISPYELHPSNYRKIGRDWARLSRLGTGNSEPTLVEGEKPTSLEIKVFNPGKGTIPKDNSGTAAKQANLFDLTGLTKAQIDDPDRVYMSTWDVSIIFSAGSIQPPSNQETLITTDGIQLSHGDSWLEENCVTPIVSQWSLIILGGGKVITKDMKLDISEYVTNVRDGWTAEDLTHLNHEATVDLYLPTGAIKIASSKVNKILALQNKQFFVTISYWWDASNTFDNFIPSDKVGCAGLNTSVSQYYGISKLPKATTPDTDPTLIQLTGICTNMSLKRSVNVIIASLTIKDYSEVLKTSYIMNSPFFDGMRDVSAIYELARMTHIDDADVPSDLPGQNITFGVDRRPLAYLKKLSQDNTIVRDVNNPIVYNGEKHLNFLFNLPGSYSDLNENNTKFNNMDPIFDCIKKFVSIAGKTFYFDQWGVLMVELSPVYLFLFSNDVLKPPDPKKVAKAGFVTTPLGNSNTADTQLSNKIFDPRQKDFVTFDPTIHAPFQLDTSVNIAYMPQDAFNHLSLWTFSNEEVDPDTGESVGGFVGEGKTFYEQIWNPNAEGFFGYRKVRWLQEPLFGNRDSLRHALNLLAKEKFPPLRISFECYGCPGLKAFDIIYLNQQPLYITEISHEIQAGTNNWRMNITGEWAKTFDKTLAFLNPSAVDTSNIPIG